MVVQMSVLLVVDGNQAVGVLDFLSDLRHGLFDQLEGPDDIGRPEAHTVFWILKRSS